jgi:hypothetical protein
MILASRRIQLSVLFSFVGVAVGCNNDPASDLPMFAAGSGGSVGVAGGPGAAGAPVSGSVAVPTSVAGANGSAGVAGTPSAAGSGGAAGAVATAGSVAAGAAAAAGTGGMGGAAGAAGAAGSGAVDGIGAKAPFTATGMPIMATDNTWTWVPFADTKCRSGTPAGIGVNMQSTSKRLMIYLEGGGACFDSQTCGSATVVSIQPWRAT